MSAIGGSRVIQHWDVSDDKNKAKEALRSGNVDVLTLSPIHLPDEGIEKFAKLALEHNPNIRVTVQEFWLPFDIYDTTFKLRPQKVDHNAPTAEELRKLHEPYFQSMDDHVRSLNKLLGKEALFVVPVGTSRDRPAREDHRRPGAGAEARSRTCSPTPSATPGRRCRPWWPTATSP